MKQLLVRRLDEELVRRLKLRAARAGHSAEEEHRRILEHALRPSEEHFWIVAERFRRATAGRPRTDSSLLAAAVWSGTEKTAR